MTSLFIDSTVLLHAVGGPHPMREPSHILLGAAGESRVTLHASVEAGQEFLFHRMRRVGGAQAAQEFRIVDRLVLWHSFDQAVLRKSVELSSAGRIGGRDAVHAATAFLAGFNEIVSADRAFDGVPGLLRHSPADVPGS
ncbi:type II toxin-antitoxin system VapC family toxin [Helcobacillus massiliensis]|uniref:type II toxin-antitoxin system VapC family toxin n=2 Tax=Helcobacillus massiliensis TaxID=521392 RepID=UPI00255646C3|nr:type II toxin-antitoxin system VapC family toxin [Helcobacillus massiliensis]MDK7741286.1 type II toxin-antitoxin system VapC family toxin [Helcobacillus massiliensis]